MKLTQPKKALSIVLLGWFLLFIAGCMKTTENTACSAAVEQYLQESTKATQGTVEIKKGDSIVVDYIGRLQNGEVFDTSVESVAKACWSYQTGRNYNEWLGFVVGAGQMIAGFDSAVEWMKTMQTKTVTIEAKDAYGEKDETKIFSVEKSKIQNPEQYVEWMVLAGPYGQKVVVTKVTNTEVFLDTNHELAGKDLIFDITIKEIK